MKNKKFKILLIVVLVYWILSTIDLLNLVDMLEGTATAAIFPGWLRAILTPGYFVGFLVAFAGGNTWGMLIAQIIVLAILMVIAFAFKTRGLIILIILIFALAVIRIGLHRKIKSRVQTEKSTSEQIVKPKIQKLAAVMLGDQTYQVITIDSLTWMTENLNYEIGNSAKRMQMIC